MNSNRQSDPPRVVWPFDLRVFAAIAGLWSLCLALSAIVAAENFDFVTDPIETIFAGVRFNGYDAHVVLIVQAGIFAAIAIGVFFHHRWGLLLALCYMAEVVMSHLAFVIAYFPIRSEWTAVRSVASQGPMMVLITLYLWIRACDLIFDPQPAAAPERTTSEANHRSAVRENSDTGEIAAMAD